MIRCLALVGCAILAAASFSSCSTFSGRSMPKINSAAIVRTINRHGVRHVIIGGIAPQVHVLLVPTTIDIDITPETRGATKTSNVSTATTTPAGGTADPAATSS